MNTTKIRTGLSDYDLNEWNNARGVASITATKGSRVASLREEADGRIYVSCFIEYGGMDGRAFCDSGTYKTEAGAIRKAAGFLK